MRYWDQHAKVLLSRKFRVLRVDLPNVGETLRANGVSAKSTLPQDAAAVVRVLEHLGVKEKIYLVGHSRGAAVSMLATRMLETGGQRVEGVVAAHPYVEWLGDYYARAANERTRGALSAMSAFNPLAHNPFTAPFLTMSNEATVARISSSLSLLADTATSLPQVAREALKSRRIAEQIGLPLSQELEAITRKLEGMVGTNILSDVRKVSAPVTLLSSSAGNALEPEPLMNSFYSSLRNPSGHYKRLRGGHYSPTVDFSEFMEIVLGALNKP
jgi:pimeloyl-ACP methyl ester carboxylesterase